MIRKTLPRPPLSFWHPTTTTTTAAATTATTPTSTPELSPYSSSSDSDSDRDMDFVTPSGAFSPTRPSLADVLANTAPPPYTLSSFMAYLSQNHCLETLEFSMEAKRYRDSYESLATRLGVRDITADTDGPEARHLRLLWHRLLTAYILPGSPREINLPSEVRDSLLPLSDSSLPPPSPHHLDDAVQLVHELMEESIFLPFLNSHTAAAAAQAQSASLSELSLAGKPESISIVSSLGLDEHAASGTALKGKRISPQISAGDLPSGVLHHHHHHQSGRSPNFPQLGAITALGKVGRCAGTASAASADAPSPVLTDDSGSLRSSPVPSLLEPMTPPITPPASDSVGSPRVRHDNPWKKMGMKLGLRKWSAARDPED